MAARWREAILAQIDTAWHGGALRTIDDKDFLAPKREPQRGLDELRRRDDERDVKVGHIVAGDRLAEAGHVVKGRTRWPVVRAERLEKSSQT